MPESLPVIRFENTAFFVDIANDELRQVDNPTNSLKFKWMDVRNGHLQFAYNKITKIRTMYSEDPDVTNIRLPQRTKLDPEAMSLKYNVPLQDVIGKDDYDVIVDKKLLEQRIAGQLPTFDTAGHPFLININYRYLHPIDDLRTFIDLRSLNDRNVENQTYRFFYNPATKQVVTITPDTKEVPKDIIAVKIPSDFHLDPVGSLREASGQALKDWLTEFPLIPNLKATIVPLSETGLAAFMKKNNIKFVLTNRFNSQNVRTGKHR
jgi:hypothetical protein